MIDKNDQNYVADVKILDVEKRYGPGPKHYVYVIQVTWANPANVNIIYRRYTQFFDLQCKLLDLFVEAPSPSNNYTTQKRLIPFLPGKIFLGRSQIRQIALERKHALDIYCRTLIALPERISRSRPVLDFFQTLSTDVQNTKEFLNNNNNNTNAKKSITPIPTDITEPTKLPTFRCLDDFTAVEKTEISLKRNTLVQVIQKQLNGWWFVQNGDRTGFVPGTFLKPVEQEDTQQVNTPTKSPNDTHVVNKSYEGKGKDELSLTQGSFVTVLAKSYTGWWKVRYNDLTGRFPAVHLTSCEGRRILPENIVTVDSNRRSSVLSDYERKDDAESLNLQNTESEIYYVHSNYHDEIGDCGSLQRGDMVEIHEKHTSGWWLGRRLKDDFILTWLPSAFLQKEPISNTNNNELFNSSSHSKSHLNIIVEQNVSDDNVYENIIYEPPKDTISTGVLFNKQKVISQQPSISSNDNIEIPTRLSVRDLVRKFSQQ